MTWRIIPRKAFPALLKFYATSVGAAVAFAIPLLALTKTPDPRMAGVFASIWLSIGQLWVGVLFSAQLQAVGVNKWKIRTLLIGLLFSPAALLYVFSIWGPVVCALLFLAWLVGCMEPVKDGI
jgi:hypothetical protein